MNRQFRFALLAAIVSSIITACLQIWFVPLEDVIQKYMGVGTLAGIYVFVWLCVLCVFRMKFAEHRGLFNPVIVMFGAANLFCLFSKDVSIQAFAILGTMLASLILLDVMGFRAFVASFSRKARV